MRYSVLYGLLSLKSSIYQLWIFKSCANYRLFYDFFCSISCQEKPLSEAEIIDASWARESTCQGTAFTFYSTITSFSIDMEDSFHRFRLYTHSYCLEKVIKCNRLAASPLGHRQGHIRKKEKKNGLWGWSAFLLQLCHVEDCARYLLPCTVKIVSWIIKERNIPGCISSHLHLLMNTHTWQK